MPHNADLATRRIPAEVSENIRSPKVVTIRRGEKLCRVGSSTRVKVDEHREGKRIRHTFRYVPAGADEAAASPWWFRHADFRGVEEQFGGRLSDGLVARFAGAVKQSWGSLCDLLLHAVVLDDINAWAGPGRTQRERAPNGIMIIWRPSLSLPQLYIPGIADAGRRTPMGYVAMNIVECRPLVSQQLWDVPAKGHVPFSGR